MSEDLVFEPPDPTVMRRARGRPRKYVNKDEQRAAEALRKREKRLGRRQDFQAPVARPTPSMALVPSPYEMVIQLSLETPQGVQAAPIITQQRQPQDVFFELTQHLSSNNDDGGPLDLDEGQSDAGVESDHADGFPIEDGDSDDMDTSSDSGGDEEDDSGEDEQDAELAGKRTPPPLDQP